MEEKKKGTKGMSGEVQHIVNHKPASRLTWLEIFPC